MAAPQSVQRLLNIQFQNPMAANERRFAEAILTSELISTLMKYFNNACRAGGLHAGIQQGDDPMLDRQFIQAIIGDIIAKGDYTLEGIARYTGLHEDLIHDAAIGINAAPSVSLFHRLVTLHRTVRPELYDSLRNTILSQLAINQEKVSITK